MVQRFREDDYHCASAVAVQVVARETEMDALDQNGKSRSLRVPAQTGKTLILLSSAASWKVDANVAEQAQQVLNSAAQLSFEDLRQSHARWWADYWSRTFVHLSSPTEWRISCNGFDRLAPYPMGSEPRAIALQGGALADDVWAAGYLVDVNGSHNSEDVWLNPIFPFEDWTLETHQPEEDRTE